MPAAEAILAGGRLVDAILLLVLLEGAAVLWLHGRRGRGAAPARVLPNLVAGAFLLLALRAALADQGGGAVLVALGFAGIAHGADIVVRVRDPGA